MDGQYVIPSGATNVSIYIFIKDSTSTNGEVGLTGLVFNSAGLTCYYVKDLVAAAQLSLVTLAAVTTAHADGGFIEIDSTNMPGWYRLDFSDTMVADTPLAHLGLHLHGATNMAPFKAQIQIAFGLGGVG